MDILTFISSVVGSIAWPLTLLCIAVSLYINRLVILRVIKTIKYKDVEVNFREEWIRAKEEAENLNIRIDRSSVTSTENILRLAHIDPGVAMLRSWQRLEDNSRSFPLFERHVSDLFARMNDSGLLERSEYDLYRRLSDLRNIVIHGDKVGRRVMPSVAEAIEYDEMVNKLSSRLNELSSHDLVKPVTQSRLQEQIISMKRYVASLESELDSLQSDGERRNPPDATSSG